MSNQNFVLVVDNNRKPLTPCNPAIARKLLSAGKASVLRRFPFTIVLHKEVNETPVEQCQIKIDPGSKTTGVVLLKGAKVIWAMELTHRGEQIKLRLKERRAYRRSRRNRKTRYRQPRFKNRTRPLGWLPPSLQHRVSTTMTWVKRLSQFCAVDRVVQELVKFDTQLMQDAEISGVEYQQGTLLGYTVREYLLEKWGRECVYCGALNVPLQIEHIHPLSKGGSNRVSNLTLACEQCNRLKGSQEVKEFLSGKPDILRRVLSQRKQPLKDAAAVNATRWALWRSLSHTGVIVTTGSGGQTKYNRYRLELPKTHWLDAACVGTVERLDLCTTQPLLVSASRNNCRQRIKSDKYGFPAVNKKGELVHNSTGERVHGFQTGDIVRFTSTTATKHRPIGTFTGRVSVRSTGNFNVKVPGRPRMQGISYKVCSMVHLEDGYSYGFE
jgi:5-methylcytosine-specific restriction endonuclease McrA